jgi:scyllo-inositol 2-dehydrogenase (NADP+)
MNTKIRTLIVGFGISGKFIHLPLISINSNFQITGVVKKNITVVDLELSKKLNYRIFDSLSKSIEDPKLFDLVVLSLPNRFHEIYAKQILKAGLDLVIEKPMAGTQEQVTSIFELASKTRSRIFPFQNRRWDSDFLTVQKLISNDQIGKLELIESNWESDKPARNTWRNSNNPDDLGGIILDIGTHLIDQIVQILGPIDQIKATSKTLRENAYTEDYFEIYVTHRSGVKSILRASNFAKNRNPRFILHGDLGRIILNEYDNQESYYREYNERDNLEFGLTKSSVVVELKKSTNKIKKIQEYEQGNWAEFYDRVFRSIKLNEEFIIKEEEIIYNHRVIDAVKLSSITNKAVKI